MEIKLAGDTVSRGDLAALAEWLLSFPLLTKGPLTEQLETQCAHDFGSKHAIFVSSGSSANLIAANALIGSGRVKKKTVIVPAVAWVTTITPFLQLGYEVILCDCDPDTLGVDLDRFEDLCRRHRPDAAIIVHVLGHDSSIHAVQALCAHYGVSLIEDACEAIGSDVGGRKLGTFGALGTYSLYFGHQISSIEGGFIVTDDYELAQICKSMRAHGWARDLDPAFRTALETEHGIDAFQSLYTFYYSGFNCRSTDLNAFLALRQLDLLPEVVRVRERNYHQYRSRLGRFWAQSSKTDRLSSFAYGMIVANRLDVATALKADGIETRPLICGSVARQPFMKGHHDGSPLPRSDLVHSNGLYLPNHLNLSEEQIDHVAGIVNAVAIPLDIKAV